MIKIIDAIYYSVLIWYRDILVLHNPDDCHFYTLATIPQALGIVIVCVINTIISFWGKCIDLYTHMSAFVIVHIVAYIFYRPRYMRYTRYKKVVKRKGVVYLIIVSSIVFTFLSLTSVSLHMYISERMGYMELEEIGFVSLLEMFDN